MMKSVLVVVLLSVSSLVCFAENIFYTSAAGSVLVSVLETEPEGRRAHVSVGPSVTFGGIGYNKWQTFGFGMGLSLAGGLYNFTTDTLLPRDTIKMHAFASFIFDFVISEHSHFQLEAGYGATYYYAYEGGYSMGPGGRLSFELYLNNSTHNIVTFMFGILGVWEGIGDGFIGLTEFEKDRVYWSNVIHIEPFIGICIKPSYVFSI